MIEFDIALFRFINGTLANPLFDVVMPWLRTANFWIPVYAFLLAFLWLNFGRRGLLAIVAILLAFALSDQISAHFLKLLFARIRPCNDPMMQVRMVVECGPGYSMPSSHAANHWCLSMLLVFILPSSLKWKNIWLPLWAFLVCFAQIYVGVHYPLDIVMGAAVGILVAAFVAGLYRRIINGDMDRLSERDGAFSERSN